MRLCTNSWSLLTEPPCRPSACYLAADYFVDSLCEKLEALLPHSFIAKQQSSFQAKLKTELKRGETADFSENYSFVLQVQSRASTGIMHKQPSTPVLFTTVTLMNCATLALWLYWTAFIMTQLVFIYFRKASWITSRKTMAQFFYFSDGAASQYKNVEFCAKKCEKLVTNYQALTSKYKNRKNFINLCHHELDFGVPGPAEWYFSPC